MNFKAAGFGILALCLFASPISALNPVHDASVEFSAPSAISIRPVWMAGGFYTDKASQKIRALVSYLLPLEPDFQIGIGAQTRWLDEPNNIRILVAGAKFQPALPWSLQIDALLGVAKYAGNGLTLSGNYHFDPLPMLPILATVRVGILDALVWNPDFAVISGSLIPQMKLHEKFRIELEAFAATQFPGVHDYFSLNLGPALSFNVMERWWVKVGAILGVAGPNKADPRFSVIHQIDI